MTETKNLASEAQAALDGITPGRWVWRGNTDHRGDVELRAITPGKGCLDVMRRCVEDDPAETAAAEWDADREIGDYIDRDSWIEMRENSPEKYIAFGADGAHWHVTHGRDLVVYEVARNQNLPDDTPRDHPKVYRADVVDVRNANARFIAAAPDLVRRMATALEDADALLERAVELSARDILATIGHAAVAPTVQHLTDALSIAPLPDAATLVGWDDLDDEAHAALLDFARARLGLATPPGED